jgi:hypothetical protein
MQTTAPPIESAMTSRILLSICELQAGGSVTNLASGTINGGVFISAGGSVTNAGTIIGGCFSAVDLSAGGPVTNEAGGTIKAALPSTSMAAQGP